MERLTSHFCLLNLSLRSYFSVSSCISHSHSSLAFSLHTRTHVHNCRFHPIFNINSFGLLPRPSFVLLELVVTQVVDVELLPAVSQNLLLLFSLRLLFAFLFTLFGHNLSIDECKIQEVHLNPCCTKLVPIDVECKSCSADYFCSVCCFWGGL